MAWNCMTMGCASRGLAVPVAALLLLATTAGAGSGANPALEIAVAAGHPSLVHLRADATSVHDGDTETATLESAGMQRLERVCTADLCTGTWFDGQRANSFGINGTPLPNSGAESSVERTFIAIASTAFAEPAFIANGGAVSALPRADDGSLRFEVTAPGGAELVAVADPRTRWLTGVDNPDRTPYRGLRATVWGKTIVYAARPYDRIVAVHDPLVPPAGPTVSVVNAPEIALLSPELPIVPCTLGGRRASCLIDSGTTPSALTLGFAEALGLEPRGRIEIAGLARYLTGVVDAGPLVLAGATFEKLHFAVIPRTRRADFDVIVGSDALGRMRVAFDRRHRRVRVAPSPAPAAGPSIALDFADGVPYAQVRLNGEDHAEPMLIDTGDAGLISIGYDEYRKEPQLFAVLGAGSARGLGEAAMDTLEGVLAHADIGGAPVDAAPIRAVRGQHVGHVGYGFAGRCGELIVDLGRGRLECSPKSAPEAPPAREQ